MPIPTEFKDKYKNEEQFTDQFLIPLLHRMGFSIVVNYHGQQEFGKDLIFAEIDQFGHVTYHGLQAKYEGSMGLAQSNGMIDDARQAFQNPFTHPNTGAKENIDRFYFANGGSIPDQTRANFFNTLRIPHGGRVRLLDSKALIALERSAAIRSFEKVSQTLTGLHVESLHNIRVLESIIIPSFQEMGSGVYALRPAGVLRTVAFEHFLARPFAIEEFDIRTVNNLWTQCSSLNGYLDFTFTLGTIPQSILDTGLEMCEKTRTSLSECREGILEILRKIQPPDLI